jgi:hypothetical protein
MHWRQWGSAAVMTISLGTLLFLLSPSASRNGHVHWYGWVFGITVNLALVGAWSCSVAVSRPASRAAPTEPRCSACS